MLTFVLKLGQGDIAATMISENSWTKRLVGCLRKILPRLKDHIQYTGTIAFPHIQSKTSTLPCFLCGCYPFQGAPDITVHSIAICNDLGRSDEGKGGNACSDESGGSEIVEHGLDKLQKEQHCPKLGQLVAGMHMILVRKVLKKFLSNKASVRWTSTVTSKGLSINQCFGAMLCTRNGATVPQNTLMKACMVSCHQKYF